MDKIIEAEDLRKLFGDIEAVDGISFHVKSGECFGILGPNGAGKTSTIRMVYGFSPMTSGRLRVFGYDISKDATIVKSRIGVCQQENSLDPDFTVQENLEIFASYFDMPKTKARQYALDLLNFNALSHRAQSKVSDLSGGLMRRLVLARALINAPDLLILDEPTTGLDPQTRHQIWERLEKLKKQGLTILLTTHYMDEASRLCDRLIIMDHGSILVEGKPISLIKEYVGHDVIEIKEPVVELEEYLQAEGIEHENLGHRLTIYGEENDKLFHTISQTFCKEGCILRMSTLEDVFLKLTGRDLRE
ncbi:ATP-binding cassette domain-containing protein [bacterium]|nr:ATP-binding cassette domain-containing protein [bacterium]